MWKIQIAESGSKNALLVVSHLSINPYLTIKNISEKLSIAYTTAQRATLALESVGIIKQVNDNKRDKVYCATAILAILEEPTLIFNSEPEK